MTITRDSTFPFEIVMEGVLTIEGHVRWNWPVGCWGLGEVTLTWAPQVALPTETMVEGLESQVALIKATVLKITDEVKREEERQHAGEDPGET